MLCTSAPGEGNIRNSVSWGMACSSLAIPGRLGPTLDWLETHHIARIAVHPNNADTAFVAALGRAWGANPERGLFRTRNEGKNWEHVLKLDSDTGCVDVVIDPSDPNYCLRRCLPRATWAILRRESGGAVWTVRRVSIAVVTAGRRS
jgi:hypothetical protein